MLSNECSIKVDNISKSYFRYNNPLSHIAEKLFGFKSKNIQRFDVLKDISFEIRKGETVAIIGANGAGKSTLLQIITGTLTPNMGEIYTSGKISALLELGAGFNPEFTGEENVYLSCSLSGMKKSEIDMVIPWIKSFSDIGDYFYEQVKTYSSGMFVRLAFSVAVCQRPEILIVDEALAVGDIFFQNKCLEFMRKDLDKTTKLVVTHDMHTVTSMCDKVILINDGKVVFYGEPLSGVETYLKHYQNQSFSIRQDKNTQISVNKPDLRDGNRVEQSWNHIDSKKLSGSMCSKIVGYNINLEKLSPNNFLIQDKKIIKINLDVISERNVDDGIVGFLICDKYGNSILGYNSLGPLLNKKISITKGKTKIFFEIEWPEIRPGEYFITLGIGEGIDPLNHNVVCWAHNIIGIKSIAPGKIYYSLFNLPFVSMDTKNE
ncbi:ABC transporter ATP-binding protein [Vibrio cholerae]|uniref:ABC transporter ATP-binding protein n=1 Tax=Vibrio cholerae TaxID=666 RepID=UPI000C998CEE|nr:ABC transporter ATP-binding protein [Vibrio cholerae]EGR2082395.1 ABC transporter ATP-binding protein [Vibrio cholerae]ELF6477672.1 ABC transporter ATP-binding protein [Vibrio cholerae]QEO42479.1 ABC transporter ATP-binding protein [Vibrio cholerae]